MSNPDAPAPGGDPWDELAQVEQDIRMVALMEWGLVGSRRDALLRWASVLREHFAARAADAATLHQQDEEITRLERVGRMAGEAGDRYVQKCLELESEVQRLTEERQAATDWSELVTRGKSPCGHWSAHAVTQDGGKRIECLDCENQRLAEERDTAQQARDVVSDHLEQAEAERDAALKARDEAQALLALLQTPLTESEEAALGDMADAVGFLAEEEREEFEQEIEQLQTSKRAWVERALALDAELHDLKSAMAP